MRGEPRKSEAHVAKSESGVKEKEKSGECVYEL